MVKKHGKKQRAKTRSRRTGAAYASAAAGSTHKHEPLPDMSALQTVPYLPDLVVDTDLATRLVAACRAACQPCQRTLTKKAVEDRATLCVLAAAIYQTLPAGPVASATTKAWAPLARAAHEDMGAAPEALEAFGALSAEARSDLLEDALDHWAMGGAAPAEEVADRIRDVLRKDGARVLMLDDLDVGDVDLYHLQPNYGVYVGATNTPDGQDFPMLTLYPETEDAGTEDLEQRTDWEHWGLHGMPAMDPRWRLRARIADRSLQGLVHVDAEGRDDIELWRASETVTMPDAWWDLLDRAQHVLLVGPSKPEALQDTADEGKLLAVVARVAFV